MAVEEGKHREELYSEWEPGEDGFVGVNSLLVLRKNLHI